MLSDCGNSTNLEQDGLLTFLRRFLIGLYAPVTDWFDKSEDGVLCYSRYQKYNYPPGSKCEALRLGVHLILLYFIRILVVGTEIIFVFGWVVGHFFCSLILLIKIKYIPKV